MSPAYFLFLLQLNHKFKIETKFTLWNIELDVYKLCVLLLLLIVCLSFFLMFLLKRQFSKGLGTELLEAEVKEFSKNNIEESNGNVISFLLGNVVPAVLIIETSIKEAVIVFIILQLIIFILVSKSSDIFPNILLIILGMDLCKMSNGKYLLIFKGEDADTTKVFQIGTADKSKLFITSYKR